MARFDRSRKVEIRGKDVTFSQRKLKSGETRYYRSGKPVSSRYQVRLAKGILEGKSVAQARGHPFGDLESKRLTRQEIAQQEEFHLGEWAEPPSASDRGKARSTYYVKVSVTSDSAARVGSPTGEEEACTPKTLQLRDPSKNTQEGFTFKELTSNLEKIILFTVESYGLTLCTGDLRRDVINIWRHSRR